MIQPLLLILEHASIHFPLVIAAYTVISLMKVPDLSLEQAYISGAVVSSNMLVLTQNWPLFAAFPAIVIASIVGGMFVGAVSSSMTHYLKFPHLLSSILTAGIFHGVNQFLLGSSNMSISSYRNLMGYLNFLPRNPELPELLLFAIILGVMIYFFYKTQLGISLAVHGNNPRFFSHYGISRHFIFTLGILFSNGLAGLGGFFDAQTSGFVDLNMGAMKVLFAITAIILGRTIVQSIRPISIWIPISGSFAYFIIIQALLKVGFNLKYFTFVHSLLVVTILALTLKPKSTASNHLGV